MSQPSLLFFATATWGHRIFAIPYTFFALYHNPNAAVEIWVNDIEAFKQDKKGALELLEKYFPGRSFFYEIPEVYQGWINTPPLAQVLRFLGQPHTHASSIMRLSKYTVKPSFSQKSSQVAFVTRLPDHE